MNIRPATADDYQQIMEMYNGLVEEDRYSGHSNDSFDKVINNPSNFLFVAEVDGKLAGFASMSIRTVVRYPAPIAELDELYVDPNQRQHGIGKELMTRVEATAREQGCYRLYIASHFKHEIGHKFYEAIGYDKYGYHFLKNL